MVITATAVSHLVGKVYETSLQPDVWPAVMRETAELLSASVGVLLAQDVQTREFAFAAVSPETPPQLLAEYESYYGQRDRMRNAVLKTPDAVQVEDALLAPADRARDEVYNDCYIRFGLEHAIGWSMRSEPFEATVVFGRAGRASRFTNEEMDVCRLLVPHFGRAIAIRTRLACLEMAHGAALETFEKLNQGVVTFAANRTMIAMNAAACAMIDADDGFLRSRHQLRAALRHEAALLEGLIARACAVSDILDPRAGGRMSVSRRSGGAPYSVVVSPVRGLPAISTADPVAVALISDPTAAVDSRSLEGYLGLTPAEAGVALALCFGQPMNEIAKSRGVSIETVRSHLKRIMAKTGTARQAELVSLLLRGPLAVAPAEFGTSR